jgi:tetratricopeptide (TPR) repeat protein
VDEEEFKKSNTKRGNDNNSKDEWKPIIEAYQAKNYDKVLELLQKQPVGMTQQEWSGLIYFKLKNYDKAASYFKTLVNDPNAILGKERIEWNLALCYAAQYPSKAKELKDILNDILSDKEHAHFEDANTLKNTYLK